MLLKINIFNVGHLFYIYIRLGKSFVSTGSWSSPHFHITIDGNQHSSGRKRKSIFTKLRISHTTTKYTQPSTQHVFANNVKHPTF